MELIICIIVGIIIGIVFGRRVFRSDVVGSLRVDQSDPDSGPYLFLELSHEGVDAIYKKKYVVLKVNIQDYISHGVYLSKRRYTIVVIDKDPDTNLVQKVTNLPMSRFDRHFKKDNLNHYIFNVYF